jgi:ribosomal RNA-processing protein 12
VTEGGSTPQERAGAFLEAALALAVEGPLDDGALAALVAAAKPLVLGPDTLLQKKGYKVLASLAEHRPAWARRQLAPLLDLALRGAAASASSAKRYRLRLLRPLILLLDASSGVEVPDLLGLADAPGVPGGAAISAAVGSDERRSAVGAALVGELVLCTKEANTKTREAAYQLLVELAHELDDARPIRLEGGGAGDTMAGSDDGEGGGGEGAGTLTGGLVDFFNAVLAGMAAGTPHMVSATVMAAARLLFEFSGALQGMAPRLLSTVLLLLRSPSREVVKSVLGFVKVAAMRLPVETLTEQLPVRRAALGSGVERTRASCAVLAAALAQCLWHRAQDYVHNTHRLARATHPRAPLSPSPVHRPSLRGCCCGVMTARTASA